MDLKDKIFMYEELKRNIDETRIWMDEPMSKHTSFKIGGAASILANVVSHDEISHIINTARAKDVPYYIVGNGSNLLVSDKGIKGIVIKIADNLTDVKIEGNRVTASAGILLSKLAHTISEQELTGFEFASGIPGTLGGAICMNAGAYDGEMKNCVTAVKVLAEDGKIYKYTNEEMDFGYRKSRVQKDNLIVLEVEMEFEKGSKDEILSYTKNLNQRRSDRQPLHLPNAGSTFKRPVGHFAGKLIDDAGLRGVRVGGAQVSEKHCGFVVNAGEATAKDVMELMSVVKKVVKDKYDVLLEPEVRMVGDF